MQIQLLMSKYYNSTQGEIGFCSECVWAWSLLCYLFIVVNRWDNGLEYAVRMCLTLLEIQNRILDKN